MGQSAKITKAMKAQRRDEELLYFATDVSVWYHLFYCCNIGQSASDHYQNKTRAIRNLAHKIVLEAFNSVYDYDSGALPDSEAIALRIRVEIETAERS
jgi:hypothetical protein